MDPLVSVIIPTKNSEGFLGECLASVKDQTYRNIEVIVVDNDSADRTKEVAGRFTDKVFNFGPERSAQRNLGVSRAKGEYVMIVDSDMRLSEKVVESCVETLENDAGAAGAVVPEESFGEGFWARCKKLERSFYLGVPWMEGARFFRKGAFLKAGGFDENMVSGEDWDLSRRMEKEGRIDRINDLIYHNEGRIGLFKTIRKKFYYAGEFVNYAAKNKDGGRFKKQTGIFSRYGLFFSQPKRLFRNPAVGVGMLFMKTCEFAFGGVGYIAAKIRIMSGR